MDARWDKPLSLRCSCDPILPHLPVVCQFVKRRCLQTAKASLNSMEDVWPFDFFQIVGPLFLLAVDSLNNVQKSSQFTHSERFRSISQGGGCFFSPEQNNCQLYRRLMNRNLEQRVVKCNNEPAVSVRWVDFSWRPWFSSAFDHYKAFRLLQWRL